MYFDERENELNYSNISKTKNDYDYNIYENTLTDIDNKKWDNDFKIDIENLNINNFNRTPNDLYTCKEGLNKGNMFRGQYDPYKNYIFKVVVKGDRDELLLKVQELTFKIIDLNLYLDVNPKDTAIYNEFKKTVEELKRYKDLYEKNYGPLCLEETLYYDNYKWVNNPWPWMNEGGNN